MQSVREDIKNRKFNKVYLFVGEEGYLRNQYKNTLRDSIVTENKELNLTEYSGNSIDVKDIIETAETAPFLSEYRLLVISDTNLFSTSQDDLADYIKSIPESTILIFSEEEIDKKRRLYKAIKDNGRVIECQRQTEETLSKWILGKIKSENKEISSGALKLFIKRVGLDMENMKNEFEKLLSYTLNKSSITEADILAICTEQVEDKIFEMIDLMSTGNQKRALELYYDLLTLKTPPIKIMTLIARQYNILFQIKALRREGKDKRTMAASAKINPYFVDKYISISNRYSEKSLYDAMELCAEYDKAFKSGTLSDVYAVELLIVKFSSNGIKEG